MLVFAAAGSHAPGITARAELAPARERELFHAAYEALRRELEAARPDAIVLVTAEHFTNFFLDNMPAFCLGLADTFEGPVEEESFLRLKKVDVPGSPQIARALAERIAEHVDISHSEELALDHGAMIPLHFLSPGFDVPVVPIIVNCFAPPLPPLGRCWELGRALRTAIDALPHRIALFGAGGISHWPAMPDSGRVNVEWDRRFLEDFAARRRGDLLAYSNGEIDREGGPGGHEIRAWLAVAGATEGWSGELLCAEPVQAFAITAAVARFSRA
jgi:2,3-dihydroxyphenylpropionate 1,2-dioxygenase